STGKYPVFRPSSNNAFIGLGQAGRYVEQFVSCPTQWRRPTISASLVRFTSTLSPNSPLSHAHISFDPEDQPVDGILEWRRELVRQVVFELASMDGGQRQMLA